MKQGSVPPKKSSRPASLKNHFALREWLVLLGLLLLLATGLGWQNGLGRLDQTIYDQLISLNSRAARNDIIIVAIDDYSLAQLGRWPWPRSLHAQLIERLHAAAPRRIGLDVMLSEAEPAPRSGDLALQQALRHAQQVVLPLAMANLGQGLTASLPIPELAGAAFALGHIGLDIDRDGVIRRVFLHERSGTRWWPHFALAIAGEQLVPAPLPGNPPNAPMLDEPQRSDPMLIAYSGGSGHIASVPYVSVLRGEVPPAFFAGKYVLIGATAIGMADTYPTPVSGHAGGMAGIELNANILAALLDGKQIIPVAPWQNALLSGVPVLLGLLCCYLLSPRAALLANAGVLLFSALATLIAFWCGVAVAPAAAWLVLLMAYPIWSWRRLEAAIRYLSHEFQLLDNEPHLLPETRHKARSGSDLLQRHIDATRKAARRVRDLRQFVSDSLECLPDATLVTTVDGYVLLANQHAQTYFASVGFTQVTGALLPYLFSTPGQTLPQAFDHTISQRFNWWDLLDPNHATAFADGVGFHNDAGLELLVRSAPCRSQDQTLTGWIVSIVDISAIRAAERSRDETLRFLSHDMRAPQASILALLELQTHPESALIPAELFMRIEKASRKTLGLADNFVQLARAESQEYRLEQVDFHDIVFDATDEMWSLAKSRRITIRNDISDDDCLVLVDRALMTRALANLLSNAINYSADETTVVCALHASSSNSGRQIVCSVTDQGYGIAAADQIKLFRRFQRVQLPHQPPHDGVGLGLVFVKTVIERHQGEINFSSKVGLGTRFTLTLAGLTQVA